MGNSSPKTASKDEGCGELSVFLFEQWPSQTGTTQLDKVPVLECRIGHQAQQEGWGKGQSSKTAEIPIHHLGTGITGDGSQSCETIDVPIQLLSTELTGEGSQSGETAENSINLLGIAITGVGGSSTADSIVGKKVFPASCDPKSKTKQVNVNSTKYKHKHITVVDTPGLRSPDLSRTDDLKTTAKNMGRALRKCNYKVHAFLMVIQFGRRFTFEMKETISDLKAIFGETFLKDHGIIVVTGGDRFGAEMEYKGTPGLSFDEWVRKNGERDGEFEKLVRECGSRICLFNNRTKDEEQMDAQRSQLLEHVEELRKKGCYTGDHLRQKQEKYDIHIQLTEDLQLKFHLVREQLAGFSQTPTLNNFNHLEKAMDDLRECVRNTPTYLKSMNPLKRRWSEIKKFFAKLVSSANNLFKLKQEKDNIHIQLPEDFRLKFHLVTEELAEFSQTPTINNFNHLEKAMDDLRECVRDTPTYLKSMNPLKLFWSEIKKFFAKLTSSSKWKWVKIVSGVVVAVGIIGLIVGVSPGSAAITAILGAILPCLLQPLFNWLWELAIEKLIAEFDKMSDSWFAIISAIILAVAVIIGSISGVNRSKLLLTLVRFAKERFSSIGKFLLSSIFKNIQKNLHT